MPYSYVTYTATAGQTAFGPITFPGGAALRDSHIKAYVNGNLVSATVSGSLSSPTVTLASGASAGNTVKIARETPVTEATRVINFVDGDVLTASDLDEANLNSLYASQEARDRADDVNTSVSGAVTSVFGRSGAVTQQTGDYTAAQVTNAVTTDTAQTITATKTFTSGSILLTASNSVLSVGSGTVGTGGAQVSTLSPAALTLQSNSATYAIDVRDLTSPSQTSFSVTRTGYADGVAFTCNEGTQTAGQNSFWASAGTCYVNRSSAGFAFRVFNNAGTVTFNVLDTGRITSATLAGTGNRAVYSDPNGILTNSSSDESLKTNIETVTDGASVVSALRPVRFDWIDQVKFGSQREIGLIAQEVQAVLPEVVGTNYDGTLTVDYPKVVAVLIGAVKELQARVAALEGGA